MSVWLRGFLAKLRLKKIQRRQENLSQDTHNRLMRMSRSCQEVRAQNELRPLRRVEGQQRVPYYCMEAGRTRAA